MDVDIYGSGICLGGVCGVCASVMKNVDLSKERLTRMYVGQEMAVHVIATLLGVGINRVTKKLDEYGIARRRLGSLTIKGKPW